ncbi:MAG: fumarylacetoacetate hydrolase family protein [Candidatus Margulisbacteria bacterium]|jgi:2-keto-4-pentenoate hydratase/2-oxohepta-3-ene-1,7-dioic acid hydratase in catechol pathway|nr:fumarylacetoacetate hydrolase family protein [Candidatus Margulisiibacteriota bacterium]
MKLKPTKIVCVGLNYQDHAAELKMPLPAEPIIFLKPPSSVIYDQADISYPPQTKNLHYEGELAVVMKDRRTIRGFTCANDVTARDLQSKDGQWTRAKSFDTFCPLGPEIVTGIDPDNLTIKTFLNGELKQSSSTANMIFKVAEIVAFISGIMTLEPDDVILTGTPPGVGPLERGDMVVVEIAGIGRLENRVR